MEWREQVILLVRPLTWGVIGLQVVTIFISALLVRHRRNISVIVPTTIYGLISSIAYILLAIDLKLVARDPVMLVMLGGVWVMFIIGAFLAFRQLNQKNGS